MLYANFTGSGLHQYDGMAWKRINTVEPKSIVSGF